MKKHKTVDDFLASQEHWEAELRELRTILASTELEETIKWGSPVYTLSTKTGSKAGSKNIAGINGFQSYFGLWFFQGALLADRKKLLINAQEGVTKAQRQMRLQSANEIDAKTIKAYVQEAIDLARRGVEIKPNRSKSLELPDLLRDALAKRPKVKALFDTMTLGKRREYAEHISSAKQITTRQRRLEKILPMIESGVGLNDRYRKS